MLIIKLLGYRRKNRTYVASIAGFIIFRNFGDEGNLATEKIRTLAADGNIGCTSHSAVIFILGVVSK